MKGQNFFGIRRKTGCLGFSTTAYLSSTEVEVILNKPNTKPPTKLKINSFHKIFVDIDYYPSFMEGTCRYF
jgi:hypothetical protein